MSKFLTGEELSKKVYDIIWEAEQTLIIVSPFIKLDDYFKKLFEKHKYNHKLHITIIFGRNESRPSKSLRREDFEFFKQFKNISIIYCPHCRLRTLNPTLFFLFLVFGLLLKFVYFF